MQTLTEHSDTLPSKLSRNRLQKIIRVKNESPHIGPLRLLHSSDGPVIDSLCRKMPETIAPRDILLTTGYGIPRNRFEIPVRAAALLLPGLTMMRSFLAEGYEPPQYTVYQATDFIIQTNSLPEAPARKFSGRMKKYLQGFTAEMYPELVPYVNFEFGNEYSEETMSAIQKIIKSINDSALETVEAMDIMNQLRRYDEKHNGSREEFMKYTAANVLYNGGIPQDYPYRTGLQRAPKMIIPIGGNAEKPFFAFSKELSKEILMIPMLTHLGSCPVYYPKAEGDILGSGAYYNFFHGFPAYLDGPVRKDIEALIAAGVTPERLKRVYPEYGTF